MTNQDFKIKAIIFDFSEVLFSVDWKKIQKDFLFHHGLNLKFDESFKKIHEEAEVGKQGFENIFSNMNTPLDQEEIIKFYKSSYLKGQKINSELLSIIKKLKSKYRLYGFTDTNKVHYEANQESRLFDNFREVFASFKLGKRKNEPEVFSEVMKSIKLRPEQCLFIDDKIINIENAKSIGMEVIRYQNFPKTETLVSEMREKGISI